MSATRSPSEDNDQEASAPELSSERDPLTGIVLAGGSSRRLGHPKALERIGGIRLIDRVLDALGAMTRRLIVAGWHDGGLPSEHYPTVRWVQDTHPRSGPLAGMHAGLAASDTDLNIVVSCDMPFINPAVFRRLLSMVGDYDAIVPSAFGRAQVTHAIYSRACLDTLAEHLGRSQLAAFEFVASLNALRLSEEQTRAIDPDLRSFFNVNTQADLDRARAMTKLEDAHERHQADKTEPRR